ncbi:hypothetical protein [Frigidibacter sp. MR17.24]|uniref:hypothetical protein n=1 Tax=Frigidibacter sp. MR17.24 TaxID=3127345 RepID=UPI003012C4B2
MPSHTSLPRRALAGALAVGLSLGVALIAGSPVLAAGKQAPCAPDDRSAACQQHAPQGQAKGQQKGDAKGQAHDTHAQAAPKQRPGGHEPKIGDSGRGGREVQQARNSRLPKPPAHQHYRVIDDRVVRVDDQTMKIVAVVGLASALLNN